MAIQWNPGILAGVTRDVMLAIMRVADIACEETSFTAQELAAADEVLLTGTTVEVLPVTTLDHEPIADGVPGKFAALLHDLYRRRVLAATTDA